MKNRVLNITAGLLLGAILSLSIPQVSATILALGEFVKVSVVSILNVSGNNGETSHFGGKLLVGKKSGDAKSVLNVSGIVTLDPLVPTPFSPTTAREAQIYLQDSKLVIAYADGATVRYKYLDLTGTGTTWAHTLTPPPAPTLTPTPTSTPTFTFTPTRTPTFTRTPTVTRTPTFTQTPTVTQTPTRTNTPTATPTNTPTLTPTP